MTKLESCPVTGRNFEFIFFLELEASVLEPGVLPMLEELEQLPELPVPGQITPRCKRWTADATACWAANWATAGPSPSTKPLGCPDYRLIELEPDALGDFLRRTDIGGLNVTIPYKRDVMPYCDEIDAAARAIGSVNTIVRRPDGKLYAYNTDAAGFCYMAQRAGISFAGRKAVIPGSGGASLTAQACARQLGAREVVVISRSGPDNYENLSRHADAEIVVNTTPVGMYPVNGAAPVDLTAFPACRGVLDVIYNPRRTALLQQAEALDIPCSDGLPMLVAQAKAAEEHFFGTAIPDGGK